MIIIRIGLGITTPAGETNFGSSTMGTTTSFNVRHTGRTEPVEIGFLSAPKSQFDESMQSSRGTVFFDEQADKGESARLAGCSIDLTCFGVSETILPR
jgi:hypothetical protein